MKFMFLQVTEPLPINAINIISLHRPLDSRQDFTNRNTLLIVLCN